VAAFQQGAYAAEQQGISMEKYGDILKDVTERVGEFTSIGAGPMIDFFENIAPKVGVTTEQFKKLSGQEALQLYVKSLEDANLSQQQMTFYMETIASDSVRLLPLFKDNSKALQEQAKRARELGVGLEDIDVAKAIAAEKALKDAAIAMDAALKKSTVAISPFITEIMKQFDGSIGSVNEFAQTIGEAMEFSGKAVGI
ncbi:MAG: phage tail tape measure protein, partial [Gammaproteobacteria bacterium]|nr:phage tail tape measure protein [Gammaproteobacteria bacterium]